MICRIVSRPAVPGAALKLVKEAELWPESRNQAKRTFAAVLAGGKRLTAQVRAVESRLPRDRFNVTVQVEGSPVVHINHIDLDIYVETTVSDVRYALHCFYEDGK